MGVMGVGYREWDYIKKGDLGREEEKTKLVTVREKKI